MLERHYNPAGPRWDLLEVTRICVTFLRLPQSGWLKATEICHLTVPETRSPKSRCQQGCVLFWNCRGESSLASQSRCWLAGRPCSLVCDRITTVPAFVVIWSPPSISASHGHLIRTTVLLPRGPSYFSTSSSFYLFMWLHWELVVAHGIFHCGAQTFSLWLMDLVALWQVGLNVCPQHARRRLNHWTTREVPVWSRLN